MSIKSKVIAAAATALADTADFAEGVDAFLNKRAPQWAQN